MRIIADHLRGAYLLSSQGLKPSNKQQGYALRRLIRRAILKALDLGIAQNFISEIIPIIAKKGETVFTPGQMKALGAELNSKPPVYVNVNVVNKASGTKTTANPTRDMNGNVNLDIIVEQIEGAIGKNISKGEGLSPILEQRYALNPAYGSYR